MKRMFKILTNRLLITALCIIMQFIIGFAILLYVNWLFKYYLLISYILSVICSIGVINTSMNSAYKITWIIVILGIPIIGVTLFIALYGRFFTWLRRRKMLSIIDNLENEICKSTDVLLSDDLKRQSDYIAKYAHSAPVKNTRAKYFSSGEMFFESLLLDLKNANERIYMEYFIIKDGYMWSEIKNILIEKADNGVEVRIIFDDMGCIDQISRREMKRLKKHGIKIKTFNPFIPVLSTVTNNRDHRKMCIIDSKIAYCGGVNIADEYINREVRFGHWKDSAIALYGDGAYTNELFFLTLWEYITKEKIRNPKPYSNENDEGIYQPYTDSPIDAEPIGENIYLNIISNAKKYIYISTPYFVVSDEMIRAITNASKCGVDVRIVVPHIPDKWAVNQATKANYSRLISAGVKVYEYERGFNHSKLVISDDKIATVGSVNFDFRSFYLSFENGVVIYESPVIKDILNDYLQILDESILVTNKMSKSHLPMRLFRAVLGAFASFL